MNLRYLKLFEAFSLGDPSKVKYAFSEKEGYTTFYIECFLKGDFLNTWCSLVKIVANEVAGELDKEGWHLGVLNNTVYKPSKKAKEEREYKLCKTTFVSELDMPISPEDKLHICKTFAQQIVKKLTYTEVSEINSGSSINLNEVEKACCKVTVNGGIKFISWC